MQNRLLTIMFLDVQGYTKRTAQATREETTRYVEEIRAFVDTFIAKHQGTLIKTMGDGFLVSFDSPTNAVQCGLEMQKQIRLKNATLPNPTQYTHFRIGINTGEVSIDEKGDLFGDPVNIAARIESFAEAGEVFISESTYLAMNRNEVGAVDLGPQSFKNATREIRIYKVTSERDARKAMAGAKHGGGPAQPVSSRSHAWRLWLLGGVILLGGGILWIASRRGRQIPPVRSVGGTPTVMTSVLATPSVGQSASPMAEPPLGSPPPPSQNHHPRMQPGPPFEHPPGREPGPLLEPPPGWEGPWPPLDGQPGFPTEPPPWRQGSRPSRLGPHPGLPGDKEPMAWPQEGPGFAPEGDGLSHFRKMERPAPLQKALNRIDQAVAAKKFAEAVELIEMVLDGAARKGMDLPPFDLARMAKIMARAGQPRKAVPLLERAIKQVPPSQPKFRTRLLEGLEMIQNGIATPSDPGGPTLPPWGSEMRQGGR